MRAVLSRARVWLLAPVLFLFGFHEGDCVPPIPVEPVCVEDADCPEGQVCAESGLCECRPLYCTIFCPYGFDFDEEGCEVCRCAPPPARDYCETHDDCVCGVDRETGDCVVGNWFYVDPTTHCGDFCTGIDDELTIECRGGVCIQVLADPAGPVPADPTSGLNP